MATGSTKPGKHVLVVKLGGVGAVLTAGPAVRAIAESAERVTFLSSTRGREAASMLPGVDEVVAFDAPWDSAPGLRLHRPEVLKLLNRIARLKVDEAVILGAHGETTVAIALLLRMVGVPRIGGCTVSPPGVMLDVWVTSEGDGHQVERAVELVGAMGYEVDPADDALAVRLPEPRGGALDLPPDPLVVVHPGASSPIRTWPPDRFAELVGRLSDDGWSVVVTGTKAEKLLTGYVFGSASDSASGRAVDFGGRTDLGGMARLLAAASVLICGQAAPLHLASAVGTPVVALSPPLDGFPRWRPWRVPHVVLGQQDIGCAGCRTVVCPVQDQPCLATTGIDEVLQAVDQLVPAIDLTSGGRHSAGRPAAARRQSISA